MLIITAKTDYAQNSKKIVKNRFSEAIYLYKEGNYEKAEQILLNLKQNIQQKDTSERISVNNLLGIINKNFGNYKSAVNYYSENLKLINPKTAGDSLKLSKTYNNIGNILKNSGQYSKAIEYYKESIISLNISNLHTNQRLKETEYIYYNLAIVFYNIGEYDKAVQYYQKSADIKQKLHLKGIDKVYFNLARTYEQLNNFAQAEYFFKKSVSLQKYNSINLSRIYKFYGIFLLKQKKYPLAKTYLLKAKTQYEKNYGFRHPYTANSYVYFGNYFSAISKPDSALYWYQKSLIANSEHFKSSDIRFNPSGTDCFSQLQLLKGLKMKASALNKLAQKRKNENLFRLSIKTSNAALHLIKNIRNDYIAPDSKLIITEIEKECYSSAVEASFGLYKKTGIQKYIYSAYRYVLLSKASLLNSISEEDKELNSHISASEKKRKNNFEQKISGYKKLIYEENKKQNPDSAKIMFLQSTLFKINNEYDNFITKLKNKFKIKEKSGNKFISVKDIQKKLPAHTTLIEYFITKNTDSEKHNLYIFIIDKSRFRFFEKSLTKKFYENIKIFERHMKNNQKNNGLNDFNKFNKSCFELYVDLLKKPDKIVKNKNIIIVPDEEIAYLSFDALQFSYKKRKIINYSDLDYLIYERCFSYGYSTPLLFNRKNKKYSDFVYAFAPSYTDTVSSVLRQNFGNLAHTQTEISSILNYFNGKTYTGAEALEDSFKRIANKGGIIHIAGHASSEDKQKDFSFLAFSDKNKNTEDDGLLFTYEIENMKINSPMVVLSACNTGKGKLYSGEGVYSLSRSFLKAGAASVVYSLWNVNDNSGAEITASFYNYLSKADAKNTALRQAKLDYLKASEPTLSDPVFWSGYVLTGSVYPLIHSHTILVSAIIVTLLLAIAGFVFLKKRKSA